MREGIFAYLEPKNSGAGKIAQFRGYGTVLNEMVRAHDDLLVERSSLPRKSKLTTISVTLISEAMIIVFFPVYVRCRQEHNHAAGKGSVSLALSLFHQIENGRNRKRLRSRQDLTLDETNGYDISDNFSRTNVTYGKYQNTVEVTRSPALIQQ